MNGREFTIGGPIGGPPDARLAWGWRLGIFIILFVALWIPLTWLSAALGAPMDADRWWWGVPPFLAAGLLASWIVMRRVESLRLAALGLPGGAEAVGSFAWGAAVGGAIIAGVILVQLAAGWLSWAPTTETASPLAAAGVLAAVLFGAALAEEVLVRGYPLQVLAERFGGTLAISVTAVVFSALHLANPNAAALPLINIGLAGILLGVAYWRTYSLWFATGVHFGWNWAMALSDLSVSGLQLGMPGYEPRLAGPELWTGGEFGPEGGLLVTLASLAAITWLWRTRRLSRSLLVRSLRPLPDRRVAGAPYPTGDPSQGA